MKWRIMAFSQNGPYPRCNDCGDIVNPTNAYTHVCKHKELGPPSPKSRRSLVVFYFLLNPVIFCRFFITTYAIDNICVYGN